jgi:biopolymer transport protein ExbD/biopolymer transport protein TolR
MGMQLGEHGKNKVRPEMNVTPLVDVVLVLLIIFMVLAPVMSQAFNVRLPPKDDTDRALDQANDPQAPLVLRIEDDGAIAVNEIPLERAELGERLQRMFNARTDSVLYLDAADLAPYGDVLGCVELARNGGARPIVMLTEPLRDAK